MVENETFDDGEVFSRWFISLRYISRISKIMKIYRILISLRCILRISKMYMKRFIQSNIMNPIMLTMCSINILNLIWVACWVSEI